MNQHLSLIRISELLSRFSMQVEILNSASMLDINVIAEDFFMPILDEIYNTNLTNVNEVSKNFPGIDLIDPIKRISFQITSTATVKKIRNTLLKINKYSLYDKYDEFYVLIILDKTIRYDSKEFDTIINNNFVFGAQNILNIKSLYTKIKSLPFNKITKIEGYLKSQFTNIDETNKLLDEYISKVDMTFQSQQRDFMLGKLKSAYEARKEWFEKKSYFEKNLVSIFDLNQKFLIEKTLKECNQKLLYYENEIIEITKSIK